MFFSHYAGICDLKTIIRHKQNVTILWGKSVISGEIFLPQICAYAISLIGFHNRCFHFNGVHFILTNLINWNLIPQFRETASAIKINFLKKLKMKSIVEGFCIISNFLIRMNCGGGGSNNQPLAFQLIKLDGYLHCSAVAVTIPLLF